MKKLKRKLNSIDGATILIALVGFMVAVMVSTVIVTAAISSMRRVINDREENQTHLTLESAAQIVRDGMEETTYTSINDGENKTESFEGIFGELMKNEINSSTAGEPITITLDPDDASVKTVYVYYSMDKGKTAEDDDKYNDTYNVIFTFSLDQATDIDDVSGTKMYMKMQATTKTTNKKTVITWQAASIKSTNIWDEDESTGN